MLKKSIFFDFLNRRDGIDFASFIADSIEDQHYINWNEFLLPHDYGDAETEYLAIRNSCAIFDVSPIRKIHVGGVGAGKFFDRLMTRPVSSLPTMRATYTVFCDADGNLKDDAILYKYAEDDYLLMPSDVDHSPYFESLCHQFDLHHVTFTECTDSWAGLAIQGPRSASVLRSMGFDDIEKIVPFAVRDYELAGHTLRISRMGFTADLGYECWMKPELADAFMQSIESVRLLMDLALLGYGLSALQVCRLEGGFIVAGWDCATELEPQPGFERSPYELGLGWLVNLDAADFVGRDALLEQQKNGHRYTLRSFKIDENSQPDDGAELYSNVDDQNESVGIVNCSSWSWGLNKMIGNASIESAYAELEDAWILLDGKHHKLKLSQGPLVVLDRRIQVPAPIDT
ncbi:MAG: aminomethyl transferase family protein [Proteobacteria bacterium]|nr:aminomethyl transferase family protein [Pseudomonadota bacterium]